MKELNTKFGKIYIEELDNREEHDRIKFYDSNKNYLEYLVYESDDEYYAEIVNNILSFDNVEQLLDYLGTDSYTVSEDWTDLIEDMFGGKATYDNETDTWQDCFGEEITKDTVLTDCGTNIIGSKLIYQRY